MLTVAARLAAQDDSVHAGRAARLGVVRSAWRRSLPVPAVRSPCSARERSAEIHGSRQTATQAADRHLGRISQTCLHVTTRLSRPPVRDLSCAGTRSRPVRQHPCVPTATKTPIERGSVTTCDRQGVNRRERIGLSSVAGRSRWRDTTASSRGSRLGRSRIVLVARRRRSRRTSTTHLMLIKDLRIARTLITLRPAVQHLARTWGSDA